MFVDIFLKNRSIDSDSNRSKCKTYHITRTLPTEKDQGVRNLFSCKLRICLKNSLIFENLGFVT